MWKENKKADVMDKEVKAYEVHVLLEKSLISFSYVLYERCYERIN